MALLLMIRDSNQGILRLLAPDNSGPNTKRCRLCTNTSSRFNREISLTLVWAFVSLFLSLHRFSRVKLILYFGFKKTNEEDSLVSVKLAEESASMYTNRMWVKMLPNDKFVKPYDSMIITVV